MVGALLYLKLRQLRNRMVASAKRLRQPKYFASALFGAAYIYWVFFRHMGFSVSQRVPRVLAARGPLVAPHLAPDTVLVLTAAVFSIFILGLYSFAWISPSAQPRLKFSEPEIAFLFSAPISRARLIHFNLLGSQFTILLSALILPVLFNRWSFLGGHMLARAVGWWLIISTATLLSTYTNLTVARRIERGGGGIRLRILAAIAVLIGALVYSVWQRSRPPTLDNLRSLPDMANYVAGWLDFGVVHTFLTPFKWVTSPFAATSFRNFALSLGPALAILGLLYFGIVRSEASFAEGSIAHAERRAEAKTAWQTTGYRRGAIKLKAVRAPFRLRERGRPEMAFFWKNLIAIQAWFNLRVFMILIGFPAVILAINLQSPARAASTPAPLVLAGASMVVFYTLFAGPQLFRQDLRSDLANADILKTYPLAGWQIVGGEILTPALLLSGILWLTLLAAGWAWTRLPPTDGPFNPASHATLILCAGLLTPLVVLLQLLIPNGAALLFPAWHQISRSRGSGLEAIGQRLIFAFGQLLAVVVALVPAVLLGVLLYVASNWYFGIPAAAIAIATAGAAAVIAGELSIALWWLGRRFECLDIASELRQ